MTSTMVQRILSRRAGADGGFAMLTVILLIMVCAAVSILMLGVVIAQVKPTVFEGKNTRTISAAEAGVDATTSQFRTATVVDPISHVVSVTRGSCRAPWRARWAPQARRSATTCRSSTTP